ncbi:MAG TPA: hypothetical protein H9808_01980 [Candidatus Atopostipes pullistercoris]|uniref:Uncharacterized protein n=1 Tax=Candidatus Atopostipes pullistercoris TaxID=2838467 RepID=A0A9D2JWS7_9LACT|nr:hypothetical protein [Candidatus Atopostipes pullistercoris]
MRVLLLILAGISGLMNAYMLGNIDEVNQENKNNFEDTLVFLGRRGLEEQKDFLFRFIKFGILLNVPYIVLSVIYFYGQSVPFILALTLIIFLVLEYSLQWRRIHKAKKLEDAVAVNPTFGKLTEFWSMAVYAIHIAYLI